MHFGDQERPYIPVSLGINENKIMGKAQLALNSPQCTTVTEHDS